MPPRVRPPTTAFTPRPSVCLLARISLCALVLGIAGCERSATTTQLPPAKTPTVAPPWQLPPPQDPGQPARTTEPASVAAPVEPPTADRADDRESGRAAAGVNARNPLIKGLGQLAGSVPLDEEHQNELLDNLEQADDILTEIKSENARAIAELNRQVQLKSDSHPHIVLVLCNQLSREQLSVYGNAARRDSNADDPRETPGVAPFVDQLGRTGVVFEHFYAGAATPEDSFWTLMTGRDTSQAKSSLPTTMTVAEMLWKAGYQTAFVGHWPIDEQGRQRGFDQWFGVGRDEDPHFPEYVLSDATRVRLPKNSEGKREVFADDLFTDEAVSVLKRRDRSRPLFLVVSYTSPGAADSLGVADIGRELASKLDRDLAEIDSTLREQRMADSTALIVTSCVAPTRGQKPLRGSLGQLYEGGLRVPCVLRWPQRATKGAVVDEPFAIWDLYHTFAQFAEAIRVPRGLNGAGAMRYFVPSRHGAPQPMRRMLYWEQTTAAGQAQAVRIGDWKAVRPAGKSSRESVELYNLIDDPQESENVAQDFPRILEGFLKGS